MIWYLFSDSLTRLQRWQVRGPVYRYQRSWVIVEFYPRWASQWARVLLLLLYIVLFVRWAVNDSS